MTSISSTIPAPAASPDSYEVALMAAGGVQSAIDAIMEGRINNAFCASSIH